MCLVATLDAMREKTVHGDRQVYHTITDVRSILIIIFRTFITQPPNQNLAPAAKTVRPGEKSFISPISRFQNATQKENMNDVRCQEMPENTLLSFSILRNSVFCDLRKTYAGVPGQISIHKMRSDQAVIHWNGLFQQASPSPSFLGKTHFFFTKFQKLFSWSFIKILISFKTVATGQRLFFG